MQLKASASRAISSQSPPPAQNHHDEGLTSDEFLAEQSAPAAHTAHIACPTAAYVGTSPPQRRHDGCPWSGWKWPAAHGVHAAAPAAPAAVAVPLALVDVPGVHGVQYARPSAPSVE